MKKIQETAQTITESNELSLRIGLPKGRDEITKLANTIDEMLERLDKSFQKRNSLLQMPLMSYVLQLQSY